LAVSASTCCSLLNFKEPIGTLLKSLLKCGGAWRAQVARMLQTLSAETEEAEHAEHQFVEEQREIGSVIHVPGSWCVLRLLRATRVFEFVGVVNPSGREFSDRVFQTSPVG
jgi:hypothetical protein